METALGLDPQFVDRVKTIGTFAKADPLQLDGEAMQVFRYEHGDRRVQDDLPIEPERPMSDVLDVIINPLLKIRLGTLSAAQHLPQSGNAGFDR